MSRTILLAATALTITSSAASADYTRPAVWEGVLQFIGQSAQCGSQTFFNHENARSQYRPYLTSGDAKSGFTQFLGNGYANLFTNTNNSAQFSGTGQYTSIGIFDAQFSPQNTGAYNLTQTPTTILATTDFVSLVGSIGNYAGIAGCALTFRAAYVRVDPAVSH
jgi:hypothetical protein